MILKKLGFVFCVLLSLTNLSFFKIGLAEFTAFHAFVPVFIICLILQVISKKKVSARFPWGLVLMGVYLAFINLSFLDNAKTSSFIYSLITLLELFLLIRVTDRLDQDDLRTITKTVVLLYSISIITGYFFIAFHINPPSYLSQAFQIYDDHRMIRPGGFSSEPSYAAIILVFSLYGLIKCNDFRFHVKDTFLYLLSVVAIYMTGSSYGYMMLLILSIYCLVKGRPHIAVIRVILKYRELSAVILLVFFVTILFIINVKKFDSNKPIERLSVIYTILGSTDGNLTDRIFNVAYVDNSAAMRIVPTLQLFDYYEQADLQYILFGRGAGTSVPFFSNLHGSVTNLGFIPAFAYNYGIIGFFLFFFFFLSLFPREKFILFVLFFLFLPNADFNTQIFLYVLFIILLSRRVEQLSTV